MAMQPVKGVRPLLVAAWLALAPCAMAQAALPTAIIYTFPGSGLSFSRSRTQTRPLTAASADWKMRRRCCRWPDGMRPAD